MPLPVKLASFYAKKTNCIGPYKPIDGPGWLQYLGKSNEVTASQKQIQYILRTYDLEDKKILHLGIGTSTLAQFCVERGAWVDGFTLHTGEFEYAKDLYLPKFRVFLQDKHVPIEVYERTLGVISHYDYVIDNNPASFSCCKHHFLAMYESWVDLLKPGGAIMHEHPRGMQWVSSRSVNIQLDVNDLQRLADHHQLHLRRGAHSGRVYSLVKPLQAVT